MRRNRVALELRLMCRMKLLNQLELSEVSYDTDLCLELLSSISKVTDEKRGLYA